MVFDYLNSIKSLLKCETIHIDNNIFKLHYKFTSIILVVFSILLTSKQYFGEPIDCTSAASEKTLVDTFCWTHGTYILLSTISKENGILSGLGTDLSAVSAHDHRYLPYKGNSEDIGNKSNDDNDILVQKYYQWVCLFFCFQALLFYIPRYLWMTWEAGRMRLLVKDLSGPLVTSHWNAENKTRIVNYLICRKYAHNFYALRFAFCEVFNFFNVILQIVLTNCFLSGYFIGYGFSLLGKSNSINPMTLVFPKLAKCRYTRFGHSGSNQEVDGLCLLPLNVLNEKLFAFLWFWFALLTMFSLCQLVYRICIMVSVGFREKLLRARCRYLSRKTTDVIVENFSFGDMFVMDLLASNLNPIIYKELVVDIANAISERNTTSCSNVDVSVVV